MKKLLLWLIIGLMTAVATQIPSAVEAKVSSRYEVRPGDVLQVEVLEDSSLNRNALVLPDGTLTFPYVGTIRASGQTVDQIRAALIRGLSPNFAAPPTVHVAISSLGAPPTRRARATITVYAMGEVARTGPVQAPPGTTLLQLLAQAGGFTRFAATRRVELHRVESATGAEKVYKFNMKRGTGRAGATRLQAGDVIVVPQRGLFELG